MKKVISKDGTSIAYDQIGKGPGVILVGGAFQYRAIDPKTARLAALLSPHFNVFHYDRRGRGDSGNTPPYAVEREVEDIAALIDEAGGAAFVYGMSSGAVLGLEAAARSLKIKKLALYEPPFMVKDSDPRLAADHAAQLARLISAGRRGDAVEFFMTKIMGMPMQAVAPMRNSPMWPPLEAVAHTLVYDATIMGDFSLPVKRIASVTLPALAIAGGASPAWAHNAVQAIAEALPDVKIRTLEGQTHDVAPEVLAPVLEEFFAGSSSNQQRTPSLRRQLQH